jgi:DNA-binding transcriptional ArsR family regulator
VVHFLTECVRLQAQVVAKAQAVRGKSRDDYKPSAVHVTLKDLKDAGIVTSDEEERERL